MNKSLLREEDVPYVNEVIEYLSARGLTVTLAGSALQGDKLYTDVDLLALGNLEAVANTTSGLLGLDARTKPFPAFAENGIEYLVQLVSGVCMYVGTSVNERFKISAGKTKVDVSLKVTGI